MLPFWKHFEKFKDPVAGSKTYRHRVLGCLAFGLLMMHTVMLAGMMGYHFICQLPWIDSFHNAGMILGGMGQIDVLHTVRAKLFAGLYAFYAGPSFILSYGVIFTPIVHRWLHHHHLSADDE